MKNLIDAAQQIEKFSDGSLKNRVLDLEKSFPNSDRTEASKLCAKFNINLDLLDSALLIKRIAGQINEVVHGIGILLLLPHVLIEGEIVEYLSLGSGNTGRDFDLETNLRIAEFKFIHWRGGPESIRQNVFFKDFYMLAEAETSKHRFLYVIGDKYPLKFLHGKRALKSVMSKDQHLLEEFQRRYRDRFTVTSEYYHSLPKDHVHIVDVTKIIPNFAVLFEKTE